MSLLERIVERARERAAEARSTRSLAAIRREAEGAPRRASFREAIARPGISLVAEAKQASPSKGTLRAPYDPAALARLYEGAGARAISVLTEPDFFRGDPAHLRAAAGASPLPILRKDFVVVEEQIWEARAWGASAVLLITSILAGAQLAEFAAAAESAGLDALVEVHTEAEAERAMSVNARLVGVNHRDLVTFSTDLGVTERVAGAVAPGTWLVAESGISTRADVLAVERAGAHGILVGEAILAAADSAAKIAELLGANVSGGSA